MALLFFLFVFNAEEEEINLPAPELEGKITVEEAIKKRRSVRTFSDYVITQEDLSQILWAAQGITSTKDGFHFRAAPSAGALYPLELYAMTEDGIYHYIPKGHKLRHIKKGDFRKKLSHAALSQTAISHAPLNIIITAIYERTMVKYGERGIQYTHIEVGHVAENIQLQAVSLDLGSVTIGAFYEDKVKEVLGCSEEEVPLYIIPIGRPE
jgi:SagB-type dehydrogenase family enzyme